MSPHLGSDFASATASIRNMNTSTEPHMRCRLCGQHHRGVSLESGERATCARCGATLAVRSSWGRDASLAFAITGLALALPAAFKPFVTLGRFGRELTTDVFDPGWGLWDHNMMTLGAWVWTCGVLAPFVLLLLLIVLRFVLSRNGSDATRGYMTRVSDGVAFWAMPEVQVLGVLVSFFKLGEIVNARTGPGFWCYAVGAFCMLMAWRLHTLQPSVAALNSRELS
jgi:paraquat-inducible protein A